MKDKKHIKSFNEVTENLNISDIRSSFSDIKKLLFDLGFHHSWGYWISNKNNKHRIKIETTKNRIYLDITKKGNYFNNDIIIVDREKIDLDDIKIQILQYFN